MKLILALVLFISTIAVGQTEDSTKYIWYKFQYGSRMPRFWSDTANHIPYGDTALFAKPQSPGFIMMHTDKNVYRWDSTGWRSMGGGSLAGLSDTAAAIRAICQWPSERSIGTIYEKSSWVNANDFTLNGTAALAINGSYLDLSGGNGSYGGNYITVLAPTNLSKWKSTVIVKLTSVLASNSAIALGLHYANTVNPYDLSANFSFTTGSSPIYVATTQGGGTVYQTSAGNISVSQNDLIKIECDFRDSTFIVTATNLTTAASPTTTTYTWSTPADAAGEIPNTCYFSIYAISGTQQIQYLKIESSEKQYSSLAMLGDSKFQVGFASTWSGRVGPLLNATYATTITRAGEGDGANHTLLGIDEIRLLAPRIAILNIGSNSYRAGFTTAEIIATYDSLTTAIEAIGTRVYHIVMPEDTVDNVVNAVGMTALKNYIAGKYGSSYISGVWDTLNTSNRLKSAFDNGDGIHLNQAGIDATVTKLINSGVITVCAERLPDDAFMVSQIANASTSGGATSINGTDNYLLKKSGTNTTNSQIYDDGTNIGIGTTSPLVKFEIPGNNTSSSSLKVGTYELQSTRDANGFLSNNGRFNGTAWEYRFTAKGAIAQYIDDTLVIYNLPAGSAGGTVDPLLYDNYKFGPSEFLAIKQIKDSSSVDGAFGLININTSSNASASTVTSNKNDAGYIFNVGIRSSAGSTYGILGNNSGIHYYNGPANIGMMADNATGYINFATGGNSERMRIGASGEVNIGDFTDQGSYTLQNTGGFYQNGAFALNLGSDATGDIYYRNSGGSLTRRAIGSTGDVLTVSGGLPVWSAPDYAFGRWLPTITAGSNVSSITPDSAQYIRQGNEVSFSIKVSLTIDASATPCDFFFSLPIASNFAVDEDLIAVVTTTGGTAGYSVADPTNDRGQALFTPAISSVVSVIITGHYKIFPVGG